MSRALHPAHTRADGTGGVTYTVKEIFLTCQGEGANIGRVAVFIRFSGCNLWSGREEDRKNAICKFCDTDFVGGERLTADQIAGRAADLYPGIWRRFCVLTGGEPLLQVDAPLLSALHAANFYIAVETNGTKPLPGHIDWVCCSPKARTKLTLTDADELKLVYPQQGLSPEVLAAFSAPYRWLSPRACERRGADNRRAAAAYCLAHPEWRLAIQAHKFWKIP